MSFEEKTAPLSISHEGVRFVFFLAPQLVMDNLDYLPRFVLLLWNKKSSDQAKRLYVSCRPEGTVRDLQDYTCDTSEADRARAEEAEELILEHLKKHFGRKTFIELEYPSIEQDEPRLSDILVGVYWSMVKEHMPYAGTRITLAKHLADNSTMLWIDFGGNGNWNLRATAVPIPDSQRLDYGFNGTMTLFGETLYYELTCSRMFYSIDEFDLIQFMTLKLMEDVLIKAFNELFPEQSAKVSLRVLKLTFNHIQKPTELIDVKEKE